MFKDGNIFSACYVANCYKNLVMGDKMILSQEVIF